MLNDQEVLGNLDEQTRKARLEKIKEFQKLCGYDPEQIRSIVSPLMQARYDEVRTEQERYISDALDALEAINIYAVSAPIPSVTTSKGNRHRALPDIIFYPSDEEQFKNELLRTKKAHFVLTYQSGVIKTSPWMADRFDITSNLRANIQSKPFWRKKTQEGLLKVEVYIN